MPRLQILFATKVTTHTTLHVYEDGRPSFLVHDITVTDDDNCKTVISLFTHDLTMFTPDDTTTHRRQ